MRKVNVMVEVSDDIFEDMVKPLKAEKSFGKVVVALLEAYYYNDAVYSYVSNRLDGITVQENSDLMKDLQDMAESISFLNASADKIEQEMNRGIGEFGSLEENTETPREKERVEEEDKANFVTTDMLRSSLDRATKDIIDSVRGMLGDYVGSGEFRTASKGEASGYSPKSEKPKNDYVGDISVVPETKDEYREDDDIPLPMESGYTSDQGIHFVEDEDTELPDEGLSNEEESKLAVDALAKLSRGLF